LIETKFDRYDRNPRDSARTFKGPERVGEGAPNDVISDQKKMLIMWEAQIWGGAHAFTFDFAKRKE